MKKIIVFCSPFLIVGLILACVVLFKSSNSKATADAPVQTTVQLHAQQNQGPALTESDYLAFEKKFQETVNSGSADKVDELIDVRTMFEISANGLELPPAVVTGAVEGFTKSSKAGGFGVTLTQANSRGLMKILCLRDVEGEKCIVVRAIPPNNTACYLQFAIARRPDGTIKIIDVYNFSAGDWVSHMMRPQCLSIKAHASRSFLAKLKGIDSALMQHLPEMESFFNASQKGENQKVVDIYRAFPVELQQDKVTLLTRLKAAQALGGQEYLDAMTDISKYLPNDSAVDLLLIDLYAMRGETDKSLEAITRLDHSVGGDPYLHCLKSGALITAKRYAEAEAEAKQCVADDPNLPAGLLTLARAANGKQDFATMLDMLKTLRQKFNLTLQGLSSDEEYAGFRGSAEFSEYQSWLLKP